jgi:hypothetical protein
MSQPVATIIAALIVALSAGLLFRWDVVRQDDIYAFKLDRWTGKIQTCTSKYCD